MECKSCKRCMFYVPRPNGYCGRCRRHAPTMQGWSVMNPDSWCGDYKLDETKVNEVNRPNYEIETIAWTNRFSGVE